MMAGADQAPESFLRQHKVQRMVLHGLLERSLLADKARELGYEVTEDEVMVRVAEDGIVYMSMSVDASPYLPSGPQQLSFKDKDGNFSKDNLRRFIQNRLRRRIAPRDVLGRARVRDARVPEAYEGRRAVRIRVGEELALDHVVRVGLRDDRDRGIPGQGAAPHRDSVRVHQRHELLDVGRDFRAEDVAVATGGEEGDRQESEPAPRGTASPERPTGGPRPGGRDRPLQ